MSPVAATTLRIGGMHCAACADTVERAMRSVPGVVDAHVSAAAQAAEVRWDPDVVGPEAIARAVHAAGYVATPDTTAAARAARKVESRTALWRLFVAALCATQVMMLAEPTYLAAPGEIDAEYTRLLNWGGWLLTLPVLLFSASPFFAGAWRSVRARRIGMDVPVALGLAIAFVASTATTFGADAHAVYFDSIAMFVTFLLAGRWLEMRARHRAEESLEASTSQLPSTALRVDVSGNARRVPLEALAVGDRLRIPLGEAFPADGRLVDGATAADESLLTGESHPVVKAAGDSLVAGSLNVGAPVDMLAERLGADTRAEAIAALMREARTQRPAFLSPADRWAGLFLWIVLMLSAGAWLAWQVLDPARALDAAIAVLIVTCPCALSLAAPTALLAAASRMGREGLLVRDMDAIARLAHVRTLFVDKTGTLTTGDQACSGLHALTAVPADELPALAAKASSLAAWSSHPLARAVNARWHPDLTVWSGVSEAAGKGVLALDEHGVEWRLGSAAWTGGLPVPGADVVLARDGRPLVAFACGEIVRDDAAAAVRMLSQDGVEVRILSGDDPSRVREVALALGIRDARGHQTPEDKLASLSAAQTGGRCVAMIGDGINDAPVLARADVAIAMGSGAALARTRADAILLSNRLSDVVRALALARRTLRVVNQNLGWAALYNAACVPLALSGHLPPWAAGLGMACSSLFVVLNSMRLGR
ncbi:MAG TPA: cation-translocating P-type ATPase [Burkholderiaceae bacterium]